MEMNKANNDFLGLNYNTFRRLPIKVELIPSTLNNDINIFAYEIEQELKNKTTILDKCLSLSSLTWDDESYNVFIPSEADIAVAVLHDELTMKLFPPKYIEFTHGELTLPIFEVDYYVDVPVGMSAQNVAQSILKTQMKYEGDFLFELLNKALRSQRNKIDKSISSESISEAMELIERTNETPTTMVANTKSFALIRNQMQNGQLLNMDVLNFSPSGRAHKNRTYVLGPSTLLGKLVKTTDYRINTQREEDIIHVSCLLRMGAVILNRSLISAIES